MSAVNNLIAPDQARTYNKWFQIVTNSMVKYVVRFNRATLNKTSRSIQIYRHSENFTVLFGPRSHR